MTVIIEGQTGRSTYRSVLRAVIERGRPVSPRDLPTRDLGMCVIELESPHDALPLGVRPRLSRRVAAAEAVQLIGGFHDPRLMLDASPRFAEFTEPDGRFHGAYGERIKRQVAATITKIQRDRSTRQAVITLWDAYLDNVPGKRDYPCTVALRFAARDGHLDMDVLMRSNDAWLGLPYDLFQFTQLQLTVARVLNLEPGRYRHTTWSLHLYLDRLAEAEAVAYAEDRPATAPATDVLPIGVNGLPRDTDYTAVMNRALFLASPGCDPTTLVHPMTMSEEWYRECLKPRAVGVTAS